MLFQKTKPVVAEKAERVPVFGMWEFQQALTKYFGGIATFQKAMQMSYFHGITPPIPEFGGYTWQDAMEGLHVHDISTKLELIDLLSTIVQILERMENAHTGKN